MSSYDFRDESPSFRPGDDPATHQHDYDHQDPPLYPSPSYELTRARPLSHYLEGADHDHDEHLHPPLEDSVSEYLSSPGYAHSLRSVSPLSSNGELLAAPRDRHYTRPEDGLKMDYDRGVEAAAREAAVQDAEEARQGARSHRRPWRRSRAGAQWPDDRDWEHASPSETSGDGEYPFDGREEEEDDYHRPYPMRDQQLYEPAYNRSNDSLYTSSSASSRENSNTSSDYRHDLHSPIPHRRYRPPYAAAQREPYRVSLEQFRPPPRPSRDPYAETQLLSNSHSSLINQHPRVSRFDTITDRHLERHYPSYPRADSPPDMAPTNATTTMPNDFIGLDPYHRHSPPGLYGYDESDTRPPYTH